MGATRAASRGHPRIRRNDVGRSSPAPSSVPGREGGAFHSAWGSIHLRPHEGLASGSKSVYTEGGRALPRAAWPTSGSWASVGCPSETCCLSVSFKVANVTSRSSQPGERTARDCSTGAAAEHVARPRLLSSRSAAIPSPATGGYQGGGRARLRVLSAAGHPWLQECSDVVSPSVQQTPGGLE